MAKDGVTGIVVGFDTVFLAEAFRSALRAREASSVNDAAVEGGAAASAILCAASACDARLSEEIAAWEGLAKPDLIKSLRQDGSVLDRWKHFVTIASPNSDLATCREFNDLSCLYQLRHHIAHRSARWLAPGTYPERLVGCIKNRSIPIREATDADWTSVVLVFEVAQWAAETARAWLDFTDPFMPQARGVRIMDGQV